MAAKAGASHALVSQTVTDRVAASGHACEGVGEHELKGVPDRWRLQRIVSELAWESWRSFALAPFLTPSSAGLWHDATAPNYIRDVPGPHRRPGGECRGVRHGHEGNRGVHEVARSRSSLSGQRRAARRSPSLIVRTSSPRSSRARPRSLGVRPHPGNSVTSDEASVSSTYRSWPDPRVRIREIEPAAPGPDRLGPDPRKASSSRATPSH